MRILVTGGAGYIGSHTCVVLLNAGYDVVVVDNLYNASEKALERVEEITGKKVVFYNAAIRDKEAMNDIFDKEKVDAVIHFAGLKAVGESVVKPIEYYENNIAGTLNLCDAMRNHGVKNISSVLLQLYTEIRHLSRSLKNARKEPVPILTDGQNGCWNRSLLTCISRIRNGMLSCFVTLTQSVLIRAA